MKEIRKTKTKNTSQERARLVFRSLVFRGGEERAAHRQSSRASHQANIDQEGTGLVRFVSVPDSSKMNRFGSVRFGNLCFPVRRGSACVFRKRRGSVSFGSDN